MAKLFCSRVTHNPYKEDMVTEITERVFIVDGYDVADRMLEGLPFCVHFDEDGVVSNITFESTRDKKWFEDNFNSKKWYREVENHAESILEEGDEVEVPSDIKEKYFKNGINCAYITNE